MRNRADAKQEIRVGTPVTPRGFVDAKVTQQYQITGPKNP